MIRMAGASTSLTLVDRLTGPLTKMMRGMDRTIAIMERMDRAANDVDTRGLQRARRDIQSASADLERLRSSTSATDRLSEGFRRIRSPVESATGAVRNFFASFAGAATAYLSLQGLANGFKSFIGGSDAMTSTSARLNLINDGLQTQVELQDKIYYAAQRSLTPYNDMANSIAKLNLLAGHAFSGNDETIRFSELMGKSFSVSGADTGERQAAMHQLTQAMASGRLQGDEYVSIIENAPLLANAIEKAMGQGQGSLKKLSSEGKITSAVIKSALFSAGAEIEEMFASLPLTFADATVLFKNWSGRAFEPLFVRFNQFVNSDAFGVLAGHAMWFVNVFIAGMTFMFNTLEKGYNEIGALGRMIAESWDVIGPIITAVGAILSGYLGIMVAVRVATLYAAAAEAVLNLQIAARAAVMTAASGATFFATVAQHGLNAAIYAFPGTWILLAFVAVIAFVIFAMIQWQDQTAAVIGFIVGLFAVLGAAVWNQVANMWNIFAMFADFLVNLFIDPKYAVEKLFYDLATHVIDNMSALAGSFDSAANVLANVFVSAANVAIGAVNGISKAIKNITGIDLGEAKKLEVEATTSFLSDGVKNLAKNLEAPTSTKDVVSTPKMALKSMPGAFNAGNNFGKKMSLGASDKLTGMLDKVKGLAGGKDNPFTPDGTPGDNMLNSLGMGDPLGDGKLKGGKLDKIGKIDGEIDLSDEDFKMLRDLAEIKSIQQTITLTPQVTFGDMTIREEADIPKIIYAVEKYMEDEMTRSAKGVFT